MADVETTQVEEIPTDEHHDDEANQSIENVQPDHEEAAQHHEEQHSEEEHHDTEPIHTEEHTDQHEHDEQQAVVQAATETEPTTVVTDEHVEPPQQQKLEEPPRTPEPAPAPVPTNDEPKEEYKPKPRARPIQTDSYEVHEESTVSVPSQKSSVDYQREIDSLTRRVAELSSALSLKEDSVKFFSTDLNRKEEELAVVNNKLAEAQRKALDLDSQVIVLQRKLKKHPEGIADDATQEQKSKPSSGDNFQYNISLDDGEKLNLEINAYATHTKLQSRNEQLHEDLKHAAEDLARAETDRKEMEVKCQQLEQEKLQFQDKIANGELQIKELKIKNDELTNALENEKKQRATMEVRAAEAQQNLSEIQEKAAKVEHLTKDLEDSVRKNDELEAKLGESQAANSALHQQVEKLTADVTALKEIVAHSQDKTRARHELQVSIVQNEVKQEKERADNYQKEIERLKAALKDAQAASQTSQQSSISSGRNAKTLERKAKAASLQIEDLKAQVETQNLEISRLTEKIKETKLACSKLSVEKSDWESKAKYLEQELSLTKGRASLAPPTVYPAPAKTVEKPGEESE